MAEMASGPPPQKMPPPELNDKLVALAVATAGEDGATRDLLRRELTKRASDRASIVALGSIDTFLTLLVESGDLTEDDGVYTAVNPGLPF